MSKLSVMEDINKLTIAMKKLLKSKERLPKSYHEGIDKLIRKLANNIRRSKTSL
jgi:hypothetical protein